MKTFLLLFMISLADGISPPLCLSQAASVNSDLNFQYGFSARITIEFSIISGQTHPVIHLSVNGGMGSNFIAEEVYPTINGEVQVYNGGVGSAKPARKRPRIIADFIGAVTVTAGRRNLITENYEGAKYDNVPLYYFSNFSPPALRNPYRSSLSLGTNLIFTTDKGKAHQRIGFFNVHVVDVQLSYYNDGGIPFYQGYIGDRRDRYYTGGGLLSYHGRRSTTANLIEVGYNKFTGYSKNAFEVSNILDLAFVDYKDSTQRYYNRSQVTFTAGSPSDHWGASIKLNNYLAMDAQHWIHWLLYDAYHMSPYKGNVSIALHGYYGASRIDPK